MALSAPVPGLRRMVNPSHDVAKVSLVVPAGEVVEASEYVAGQLERQGFKAAEPVSVNVTVEALAPANDAAQAVVDAIKGKGKKG